MSDHEISDERLDQIARGVARCSTMTLARALLACRAERDEARETIKHWTADAEQRVSCLKAQYRDMQAQANRYLDERDEGRDLIARLEAALRDAGCRFVLQGYVHDCATEGRRDPCPRCAALPALAAEEMPVHREVESRQMRAMRRRYQWKPAPEEADTSVSLDDYLAAKLRDPEFRAAYARAVAKLDAEEPAPKPTCGACKGTQYRMVVCGACDGDILFGVRVCRACRGIGHLIAPCPVCAEGRRS